METICINNGMDYIYIVDFIPPQIFSNLIKKSQEICLQYLVLKSSKEIVPFFPCFLTFKTTLSMRNVMTVFW